MIPTYRGQTIPVITLPPDWARPVRMAQRYQTTITESLNSTEERQARRPRPLYEMRYSALARGPAIAHLRRVVETAEALPVACPLWPLGCRLTATASATDTTLTVDDTDFCLFEVFHEYALLWSAYYHWEVVELDAVALNSVTLLAGLANSYPLAARRPPLLLPLAYGHVPRGAVEQLTDEHGVWECAFTEKFHKLHDQSIPEDVRDTFDATACAVDIDDEEGAIGGGDTFDCYAEDPHVISLPLAGTGWSGHWKIGDNLFGTPMGDDFDSYSAEGDPVAQTLEAGTGFLGPWKHGGSPLGVVILGTDDFDSYAEEDPVVSNLTSGPGWDGPWRHGDGL